MHIVRKRGILNDICQHMTVKFNSDSILPGQISSIPSQHVPIISSTINDNTSLSSFISSTSDGCNPNLNTSLVST